MSEKVTISKRLYDEFLRMASHGYKMSHTLPNSEPRRIAILETALSACRIQKIQELEAEDKP